MHRNWKQGHTTWEEYRHTTRDCGDEIRKARAQLELNSVKNVKNYDEGFFCTSYLPVNWNEGSFANWHGEGWGTPKHFCPSFHWQLIFPNLLSLWTSRQGLGEQSSSHHRKWSGSSVFVTTKMLGVLENNFPKVKFKVPKSFKARINKVDTNDFWQTL